MKPIYPCLWFDGNAEEAIAFYTSTFKNSSIKDTTYYGANQPGPEGTVLTITFTLNGQDFIAVNGGPEFPFTNAVSFCVPCDTQDEIDFYWDKLTADGGQAQECGWLINTACHGRLCLRLWMI